MSEPLRIALSIVVYGIVAFAYLVVALAAYYETRRWWRGRHSEPVEPSPLIAEIDRWRQARERTFDRQQITPLGHVRVGLEVDDKRGARVLRHRAP